MVKVRAGLKLIDTAPEATTKACVTVGPVVAGAAMVTDSITGAGAAIKRLGVIRGELAVAEPSQH